MLSEGTVSLSRYAWCRMTATGRVTASPAPPSQRRDFGQFGPLFGPLASRISSLIKPALRLASLRPSGKLCRQSTCGAGLLRSWEPRRPSPALNPFRSAQPWIEPINPKQKRTMPRGASPERQSASHDFAAVEQPPRPLARIFDRSGRTGLVHDLRGDDCDPAGIPAIEYSPCN